MIMSFGTRRTTLVVSSTMMRMMMMLFCVVVVVVVVVQGFVVPTTIHAANKMVSKSQQFSPQASKSSPSWSYYESTNNSMMLHMSTDQQDKESKSNLPFWLDIGTKGGAIVISLIAFIVPIIIYSILTSSLFGFDEIDTGKYIGVGFTAIATFLWVGTYIFRVATKDMTYAKQLKDYENAVIAKRLEELDDDEIQALVEEIDRDDF